jgi:antirestriction protein
MQQQNLHQGGEHQEFGLSAQPVQAEERLTDEQLIHYGITEALRDGRAIDHATARVIASQLHGGQASPLYALASSGALIEGLRAELDGWRREDTPVELEPWLDALDEYLDSRADEQGPVDGWSRLWPTGPGHDREEDEPDTGDEERPPYGGSPACAIGRTAVTAVLPAEQAAEDETVARQALFERISAAGVTTLGQVATVHAPDREEEPDEPDPFPWTDAATWSPSNIARENYEVGRYSAEELDELFGGGTDDQVGSVDELGWYGLARNEDQSGGLILIQDEQGFRRVREAPDDGALAAQWAAIQQEYETFCEQRDAYEAATEQVAAGPSGYSPRVWVGVLADYNAGRLHGTWMDATLEPDKLHKAVQFMLRGSETRDAEEWAIFDHDEFGGYEIEQYTSFTTVSRIANGVARHGPTFAEWVSIVGEQSEELLTDEAFQDHYLGEWDSTEDYVEYVLQETDFYRSLDEALERVPEDLRRHVKVDLEGIAEEWEQGLYVVERAEGGVWVFDARA